MDKKTVIAVLESSKTDFFIDDIASEIMDEGLLETIEENESEMGEFLQAALPIIMDRLKLRMAFAASGEERRREEKRL